MDMRKYLEWNGITQKKFAEEILGISLAAFRYYLDGHRPYPIKVASKIIEVTNNRVTLKDLSK